MAEVKIRTIGIDIDCHSGYQLLKAYFNASIYGEVTIYYTKYGFHLEIGLKEPIERWKALDIQSCLNDDIKRVVKNEEDLDYGYYHRFDRLFDTRYKDGGKYKRREIRI